MSATPTEVAKRWFQEVWNERKPSTISELMHSSAVGHTSSGETRGPEDWKKRVWNLLTGAFSDIKVAVDGMVTVRDGRIVEGWDGWDATGMIAQCGGATLDPRVSK